MFSPYLGPIRLLYGLVWLIGDERLTYGQTFKLRQETWLIGSNYA